MLCLVGIIYFVQWNTGYALLRFVFFFGVWRANAAAVLRGDKRGAQNGSIFVYTYYVYLLYICRHVHKQRSTCITWWLHL